MVKEEITKALKNIKIRCHPKVVWDDTIDYDLDIIEKSLKALEIIKEKNVNIGLVKVLGSVEQYNQTYVYDNMLNVKWCLTEEEFDLLKEVLG